MVKPLKMAVIGIDHRHIYTQIAHMQAAGCELAGWCSDGSPGTLAGFLRRFPDAPRVTAPEILLEDRTLDLILTAAIPAERAGIAIAAMGHGKDVLTDKPGCLTLDQLDAIRREVRETGRIWSVDFSERFEVPAVTLASELVAQGAIGQVIQVLGLGPHRLNAATRPDWFWDPALNGGLLTDIGSHQIDQFLHFTGTSDAEITLASTANIANPQAPGFRDFGQIALQSGAAHGYIRLDWFTADALPTWGDGRLFLLGTQGTIELRKYVDVGGAPGTDQLFLTNGTRCERIDASASTLPFFTRLTDDIRNRTETAMPQTHAFRVMELAIRAQEVADAAQC